MRLQMILLLCLCTLNVYAFDHAYPVRGTNERGDALHGIANSNNGDPDVYGELTDDDGDNHHFDGRWIGRDGHIEGETEEGDKLSLDRY